MSESKTIIRPDRKGRLDDVVIEDVSCFRLERMDRHHWWAACYRGDKRITFQFWATKRGRIDVTVIEDDFGAVDDSDETDAQVAAIIAAANG